MPIFTAMKIFASILFVYIMALTALPSVRAIRITFVGKCKAATEQKAADTADPAGCQKGKIIMTLNFSPIQYFNAPMVHSEPYSYALASVKKERLTYHKVFIDQYHNQIWQPPKIIS